MAILPLDFLKVLGLTRIYMRNRIQRKNKPFQGGDETIHLGLPDFFLLTHNASLLC